ncbi:alpha-N-acetylglucosaminidase TIM-barrel domain-containing protein [Actinomadura opuntiae]|uniref:alpha-N-acetylglucosaminidase TIM-barrel domain-containing protein n=1 Tax=Actinomadura sp. OS1-43 TaxID=604315 RepID=UPI00255AFD9A|nr:alpha-N-acetylglucosaminidase TIM-barrel domain-containing protein [Actinomadura sp. OS1-43]MDL4816311.1 alpha-N-acetylglucosaminidase TIM-barrel domain-containing protein [Actinomadura sp. OS1-43]
MVSSPRPEKRRTRPSGRRRRAGSRSRALAIAAAAALALPLTAAMPPASARTAAETATVTTRPAGPAGQALERILGERKAAQVTLQTIDKGTGADRFRISASGGRLVIAGTSPAVQLTGFGWYLRKVAHADYAIGGSQLDLPARLPLPSAPIEEKASVAHRFALNDTNEGYAGAYLSWDEWQRRIDALALHGVNEVLVYEGQEAVYQRAFQQFGYSAEDMRRWIPQPAHQAWWLLQNMCCTGSPISQRLIDRRTALARRIVDRLRELGITPVLPGYYGTVPTDFETRNPGANTVPQGTWNGLERPDWLDPTGPQFGKVAAAFYKAQTELYGTSTMYKMDLLHEGGRAGSVPVGPASKAVQDALEAAHPGAIWNILGWQSNPRKETLEAVDRSRMFIVDGITEQPSVTDREKDFLGTQYAFGTIWNFGGHQNFGAGLTVWNEKFHAMRTKPGSALNGIALMPEAIDNNPAALAFFTDMPWEDGPVDMDAWFAGYAASRYGAADPHAVAAWKIIGRTAYAWPAGKDTRHVTALFDDQPSLTDTGTPLQYDPAEFEQALRELLQVDPRLRQSDAYRYDLVDVARQVLANRSRTLLPKIRTAYQDGDRTAFERLTDRWTAEIGLMDDVLGTDPNFLLGAWQREAARQAGNRTEAAALDYDLKSLVTLWQTESPGLQDYARREYNGLVGGYYGKRWTMFFDELKRAMRTGAEPKQIDWRAVAESWAHAGTRYADRPHGDAYRLAARVAEEPAGALALTSDRKGVAPGGTVRVTATFTNESTLSTARGVRFALTAPRGYTVRPAADAKSDVAPGGTATATWTVTVPAGAAPGDLPSLDGTVSWRTGKGESEQASAHSLLMIGGSAIGAPYKTAASTTAAYAQKGDAIGLAAGGEDLWGDTNEFATVYSDGALTSGHAVSTKVTELDGASPWSRAGLVAANDLAKSGTGGYANIAVTPDHGCVFSYDSDGDGRLDQVSEVGGFTAGDVRVRLRRDGDRMSGSCSSDGENWNVVGSGTVPGASDAQDVGMFVSAVNRHTAQEAIAFFGGGITASPGTARDGSGDVLQSLRKPVTALSSEPGRPPEAANDGSRANSPYWGGQLTYGENWWRVDLGAVNEVSRVNVRNYVDGTRYYTYRLEGSLDGAHWFTLGGRNGPRPANDTGDTMNTEAKARYIRVVGLGNTANFTFHLTEVSVYGTPAT